MVEKLPIDAVMGDLIQALRSHGRAVLEAPPGAGKTTQVPLALLKAGICGKGKILMLEPRRLATRAAAKRMTHLYGEPVGQTIGYRMRGAHKTSRNTRIEIITEGILTRMMQTDQEMRGISAIIFDEFHERNLTADLGLALAWDIRQNLRDDLMLLVMSATLDAAPVAKLLDNAPIITAQGRSFPVDIKYSPRPTQKNAPLEQKVADLVVKAASETAGGILVFLPGEREIMQTKAALQKRLSEHYVIRPLLGRLPFADQQKAILPEKEAGKTKVVLATAIAETSLTIQDIRVVVDAGLARFAKYTPTSGLSTLATTPVSRATATQRAGRAGRVAAGVCYRLWAQVQHGALPAYPLAEIETADLTSFALELAAWGSKPSDLALLTPPPKAKWQAAQDLLHELGALKNGRITAHGHALVQFPLHPRLANMLVQAGKVALPLAAILSASDLPKAESIDLMPLLWMLESRKGQNSTLPPSLQNIHRDIEKLRRLPLGKSDLSIAQALALAYPDRVAQRRAGSAPRFVLSGGKGAQVADHDPLADIPLLVVAQLGGAERAGYEPFIRRALPISQSALRQVLPNRIHWHNVCEWSKQHNKIIAIQQEKLGAVVLKSRPWANPDPHMVQDALIHKMISLGLELPPKARLLQGRALLARKVHSHIPDVSDAALLRDIRDWLGPYISGTGPPSRWSEIDLYTPLCTHIGAQNMALIKRLTPAQFTTPLGRKIAIDYADEVPQISIRLQEMFGQTHHPMLGDQPLKIVLLSPAQRPIQITTDIAAFWRGSYAEVRKDMRARYPRHPWPEDPTQTAPTLRAKSRKIK